MNSSIVIGVLITLGVLFVCFEGFMDNNPKNQESSGRMVPTGKDVPFVNKRNCIGLQETENSKESGYP